MAEGGFGGGFGLPGIPGAADEEPQLASDVPMPIAAIVFNMAQKIAACNSFLRWFHWFIFDLL